jgi:hypothetical protein
MAGKLQQGKDVDERIERHVIAEEITPEAIPEAGEDPDVAVTADLLPDAAPMTEGTADDLTPETLIGDPRDERPISHEGEEEPPAKLRRRPPRIDTTPGKPARRRDQ